MKIHEIKKMIKEHGSSTTLGELLERAYTKFPHVCPKCNGVGSTEVRYNAYPKGLPDSGWVDDWQYKTVECDVCDGEGYTKDKLIAKSVKVEYVKE